MGSERPLRAQGRISWAEMPPCIAKLVLLERASGCGRGCSCGCGCNCGCGWLGRILGRIWGGFWEGQIHYGKLSQEVIFLSKMWIRGLG